MVNLISKLILPTFRLDAQLKHWKEKFQDQVVFQENLYHFMNPPCLIPILDYPYLANTTYEKKIQISP